MAYKAPIAEPIAIVGSSCRFAGGATSPSKLWDILENPTDLSRRIPDGRFNIDAFFHPDGEYHGTTNSSKAYFLDQDPRVFDAAFFNITPKEAEAIDPQQRMLLEVVYEALEASGYTLQQYSGEKVAVFAGIMTGDYDTLAQRDEINTSQYYATGNARSIVSNRVSYFFNFRGPSMTIDTACSASLVALHQAVLSLRSGECGMACVTGANLILTPEQFIVESSLHMLSPTGHCRMWDAGADGYARGEGVTAMFIKPLSKALADGDRIEAIIRDTGCNSDGRSQGITMPNWTAQSQLIQDTYSRSGLDPRHPEDRCQYFEAHGTGTPAGDPNEARAIEDAFFGHGAVDVPVRTTQGGTPGLWVTPPHVTPEAYQNTKLFVGSVKTVIGHTEGSAGLAGVVKVVQAMCHDTIPPNLHLEKLNPNVEQYCAHLQVPTRSHPWPSVPAGQPKRASVNSFGFGGANAHAIIEEYIPALHNEVARCFHHDLTFDKHLEQVGLPPKDRISLPLVLSASSQKSLIALAKRYLHYLMHTPPAHVESLAWHSYAHRTSFPFRIAITGVSAAEYAEKLQAIVDASEKAPNLAAGVRVRPENEQPRILGIFTGQGSQWATMSSRLLDTSSVFASSIRTLDQVLQACPHPPNWSLEEEIAAQGNLSRLHLAAIAQPLTTSVQLALVDLLKSLGISFHAVVGHSSGEIAAAYAAGRLSAREAILISYYRGMYAHLASGKHGAKGAMLAAGMSKDEAMELCSRPANCDAICLAAHNSPSSVTLSGDTEVVHRVLDELTERNLFARLLHVDTAYHSPHMELPASRYIEALQACKISPSQGDGRTLWVSSVSGDDEPATKDLTSSYWKHNMTHPVLFAEALEKTVAKCGTFDCAIEVGPHPALKGPVTQTMKAVSGVDVIPYTGILARGVDDRVAFSEFLGWLWTRFGSTSEQIRRFVLGSVQADLVQSQFREGPTYPWDHSKIHWRESRLSRQYHFKPDPPHELLGVRTRDDTEFELRWRNIWKFGKLSWVKHHSFQGQALVPGSAYLILAVDAARVALGGRSASIIELQDLVFPSGIILEESDPHGVEILFSLMVDRSSDGKHNDVVEGSFILTSTPADGSTTMKKNFGGRFRILLEMPSADALPTRELERPETLHASPEAFYEMMAGTGLLYTGPFKGLKSLDRRFEFASATVQKYHEEDTTKLSISPATLDSCLQTAFVSVAAPGDKSIWTSFLPEKIESARFNMAICDVKNRQDTLSVDTHLTDTLHLTRQNAASFTAEICIFDAQGNMEIQVEGLTVGSFTSTKPEDDFELYLTTVTNVDPDDEIISASPSDIHALSPMLIESCERVASYFLRDSSIEPKPMALSGIFSTLPNPPSRPFAHRNPWPRETESSLAEFILQSPHHSTLNFIYQLGHSLSDVLAGMLPTIVEEAHQWLGFQRHISRIVGQISHKYARMNVLGLTDVDMDLAEHVLAGLKDSFQTFRVGAGVDKGMIHRGLATDALRKKVQIDPVDLSGTYSDNATKTQYDLVVLSTSLLDELDPAATLLKVKGMMRPGGFLLLVHTTHQPLQARIRRYAEASATGSAAFKKLPWSEILDNSGFPQTATCADQHYPPGFTIMVRQSESHEKQMLLHPMGHISSPGGFLTDKLVIIGGKKLWTSLIASGASQLLESRCHSIRTFPTIEEVDGTSLSTCSAVILLQDIDQPVLATMTEPRLDAFRALFRPEMVILWVTLNARFHDPDHAASLGFTRTMRAETPGLILQALDLDTIESLPAVDAVCETFARLAVRSLVRDSRETPLWINEQEIHYENGTRLVPRVVPWTEGIERVNANRRVVSKIVNTLENRVDVVRLEHSNGKAEYVTTVEALHTDGSPSHGEPTIKVDYSNAEAFVWGPALAGYVCMGRNTATYQLQVALSTSNASYISIPPIFVRDIPERFFAQMEFIKNVVGYLAFFTMVMIADTKMIADSSTATFAEDRTILLIEPDAILLECVKLILNENVADIKICLTDKERCKKTSGAIFLHPRASIRESKAVLNPKGTCIFNFLPDTHNISKALAGNLPRNCDYHLGTQLLALPAQMAADTTQETVKEIWDLAVSLAIAKTTPEPVSTGNSAILTVPELLNKVDKASPFQIVDWRADRTISHIVQPLVATNLLKSNKTYVLVGITRDFGQSLCTLFVSQGARHIVLASRNPPKTRPVWQEEMALKGIDVRFEALDVTDRDRVMAFKARLAATCPPVGGVVNGAMILDDRVFSEMSLETFHRVMRPKTIGSQNLDDAFHDPDMDFFIMTSSFAAIGGHAGQSNYAAANMYMNGLAASRRHRGLAGSALNIGVLYGIGFLHREKNALYEGLAREGYPPISERDLHHMFVEAIAAGKPTPGQIFDITTGLSRFPAKRPTIPWQSDPRFSHFVREDDEDEVVTGDDKRTLKELLGGARSQSELHEVVTSAFTSYLEGLLHLQEGTVVRDNSLGELGVDSLAAVEVRSWIWKSLAQDVAVMKIIGATSINNLCLDIVKTMLDSRPSEPEIKISTTFDFCREGDSLSTATTSADDDGDEQGSLVTPTTSWEG